MPPGAKKRKALKKKQQQHEAIETTATSKNFNGDNLHGGNGEHGSQDDRESDSTLSSPGSQANEQFGGTKHQPAFVVKDTTDKNVALCLGPKSVNALVEKSPISSYEYGTQTAKYVSPQDPCGDSITEISHVVDSVSKVVISEKSEHAETSTHSNLVKQKFDEKKKYHSLERDNGKVATLPGPVDGTSRQVEIVRESEAPVSSEQKVHKPSELRG